MWNRGWYHQALPWIAIVFLVMAVGSSGCTDDNNGGVSTPTPTTMPMTETTTIVQTTVSPTPPITIDTNTTTPTTAAPGGTTVTGLSLQVTAPTNGSTVTPRQLVEGTSQGVYGTSKKLYVIVYPTDEAGGYWVQPGLTLSQDGSWSTKAYFGRDPAQYPQDQGAHFRVIVLVTDQTLPEGQINDLPPYDAKAEIDNLIRA